MFEVVITNLLFMTAFSYRKILECWILNANERPTFTEMAGFFAKQRRNEYTVL